jgi:cell shape-determining protein MreD
MKFKPSHRRTLVVFCWGLILFVLARQANHALAGYGLSMWLGGLLVAFPALRLSPQQGFNACFALGLLVDAFSPFPFGLNAFLFGVTHLVIVRIRNRLASEETVIATVVALISNLALFLVLSFFILGRAQSHSVSGLRLLSDLLLSQLVIGLTAGWFFALQERALGLARVGVLDEPTNAY